VTPKPALVVFVKAPVPGFVKTRLQPQLTPEQSAALCRAMVEDLTRDLSTDERWNTVLFYSPPDAADVLADSFGRDLPSRAQAPGNLGDRMLDAFTWAADAGYPSAVVIGSDAPTVGPRDVAEALARLEDHDVVLGPSEDGGYYLVAMKEPLPQVFEGMEWSTPSVLRETLSRIDDAGLSVALLDEKADVDTYDDVRRLWEKLREGDAPGDRLESTRAALEDIMGSAGPATGAPPAKRGSGRAATYARLGIVAAIALAVTLVFRLTALSPSDFTPSSVREFILALGVWGPIVFMALYATRAVVLVVPVGIMSLAGGLAYGRGWGTVLILAGATLGSCLAFLVARYAGRRFIEQFAWLHRGKIRTFDEGTEEHGFRIILMARLIPIFQYDALNYGAGLSRVKFRDYALATAVGMIPGAFISASLGSSLTNVRSAQFLVALAAFILLALIPVFQKMFAKRRETAPR